jgi:Ca2+/Na+ antiporter
MTAHDFLKSCAGIAIILCGVSYLYWLREIGREVNETLPKEERRSWSLTEPIPPRMHSLWSRHEQVFPKSRKRVYAAVSLILMFLTGIISLTASLLATGRP